MKKLNVLILSALSLTCLSGCLAQEEQAINSDNAVPSENVPGGEGGNTNPGGNTQPGGDITPEENPFANTVFNNGTFTYDGEPHSIYVTGAPEGSTVSYTNNGQIEAGTYRVYAEITLEDYPKYTLDAVLTINRATFSNIVFENSAVDYDGEPHSIYVTNAPDFAKVTYSNNGKTDVGSYSVTATISADNYNTLTKTATLTIKKVDMSGVTFESKSFMYDGQAHSITVEGAPTGSTVTYKQVGGNGTNSFSGIGTYNIQATISHKNYNTKVLTATLIIQDPSSILSTDSNKQALQLSEPLMWDPIFDELMKGNYTLYLHSGYWDTDAPDVKNETGYTLIACDGQNCFSDYYSTYSDVYHSYTIYSNCGDDIVVTNINDYNNGGFIQEKFPAAGMNETVIQYYIARAFVSLQKDENDGSILPGIDMDDYYKDVGTATLENGRFVVTMQHPRNLDNGEQRYFYEAYEFYNIGNTKLDIPSGYFLNANEIAQLSRTDSTIFIDGVAYGYRLRTTYNSGSTFTARTYLAYYQQLIVKPGVHTILPDIYGEIVHRVVYSWYTEDYSSILNMDGYELNVYFDENLQYQGEYADYGELEFVSNRFVNYGGVIHYYDEWHQ